MITEFWHLLSDRTAELLLRTGQHLTLSGIATVIAILIGLPLGILIFRYRLLRGPVLGVAGVLQTIPSIAMLVFLLAITGKIGFAPALIALILYALLPIVVNTHTGLNGVSPDVMEAARGIGMTGVQQMVQVRIPLAMPVIMAGVRTAAVISVGIATLSAFIGAGGLGQFINRGLAMWNIPLILLGAIPSAVLALMVYLSLAAMEWGLSPTRSRRGRIPTGLRKPLCAGAISTPLLMICLGLFSTVFSNSTGDSPALRADPNQRSNTSKQNAGTITIGSKNFSEQFILGELMAQLIEARTDLTINRQFNLAGTMICHGGLESGELDLYAEYTGTGLTAILKEPVITDPDAAYRHVQQRYLKKYNMVWLAPFGFNNTYAITVRKGHALQRRWQTISDLRESATDLVAGFTAEFAERPDGYPGLREKYGFSFKQSKDLEPGLMYQAVSKKEVDVICAFATDGRIAAYDLLPLEDNHHFFPPYYAAPVIGAETLTRHPEISGALAPLAYRINDKSMQQLNFKVDNDKMQPADVAREWLLLNHLIPNSEE